MLHEYICACAHIFSSETSDKGIKAVNQLNVVNFLISFLSAADQCPTKVVVAAGNVIEEKRNEEKSNKKLQVNA